LRGRCNGRVRKYKKALDNLKELPSPEEYAEELAEIGGTALGVEWKAYFGIWFVCYQTV